MTSRIFLLLTSVTLLMLSAGTRAEAQEAAKQSPAKVSFVGSIIDADTHQPIAARVYIQDSHGNWLFVRSATDLGSAWPYSEEWVPMPQSVERHTTVSAHPFTISLPPGEYQVVIERGKEYLPLSDKFLISDAPLEKTFSLQRWSHLAAQGWYSGETHVHRRLAELPNVMQAEQLNVAFPVTYWTTRSDQPPNLEPSPLRSQGPSPLGPRQDVGAEPIFIDQQTVIVPRNTEYEIFSIGDRQHTLGALFVLNHQSPFPWTAPPVGPIIRQARAEGALLDLDKHNWPWSLMLVALGGADLYELSNNSVWRTNFGFKQASQPLPSWAEIEQQSPGVLTEWGWLQYGFEIYYALLNCGFRLSPTAGTASGVHPVPLGYSRVYVHTGESFCLERWLEGLKRGRSFVTTGPLLLASLDSQLPGSEICFEDVGGGRLDWSVDLFSQRPLESLELIVNGQVRERLSPESSQSELGTWRWHVAGQLEFHESSWVCLRAIEPQEDGRKRFVHTGPWWIEVAGRPLKPPRQQVQYLVDLSEQQLAGQRDLLAGEVLAEFEKALQVYRSLLSNSR